MMKKILTICLSLIMSISVFTGCTQKQMDDTESTVSDAMDNIKLVTREVGAGIRTVAADLFGFVGEGIEDLTHRSATVKNKTADVVSFVANEEYAAAYVPLSAVNDKVKTLKVDGNEPSAENVKNGKYKFAHKLYAISGEKLGKAAEDFLNFILSKQGQQIVTEQGFVSDSDTGEFSSNKAEGNIKIYCVDSTEDLMKKFKEAYGKINDKINIKIEVENSKEAIDEIDDDEDEIAVTTRPATEEEKRDEKLNENPFAREAIAVIVNPKNDLMNIKSSQVTEIIKGNTKNWSKLS